MIGSAVNAAVRCRPSVPIAAEPLTHTPATAPDAAIFAAAAEKV